MGGKTKPSGGKPLAATISIPAEERNRSPPPLAKDGDNLFDVPSQAKRWAEERSIGGGAQHLIAASISSSEPRTPDELVYHNIRFDDRTECSMLLAGATRRQLNESVGMLPTLLPSVDGQAFKVHEDDRGDHGLFAERALKPGSIIFVERPLLVSPSFLLLRGVAMKKAEIYRVLVDRLPEAQRKAVRALFNCKPPEACGLEEGIVRTNGVAIELETQSEGGETHSAVFPTLSRCNHSCSPNVAYLWDLGTFSLTLFALRSIKPGEEITITYTHVTDSRDHRQGKLDVAYDFVCKCTSCGKAGIPGTKLRDDDKDRATLGRFYSEPEKVSFEAFEKAHSSVELRKEVLTRNVNMVRRIESLGLQVHLRDYKASAHTAVKVLGALGARDKFEASIKKAIEVWNIDVPFSALSRKRVKTYEKWLADPTKFSLWETKKSWASGPVLEAIKRLNFSES